jgi:hypothetical protein
VQALLQPTHTAPCMLDPLYAVCETSGPAGAAVFLRAHLPNVSHKQEAAAHKLIRHTGGEQAAREFDELTLGEYSSVLRDKLLACKRKPSSAAQDMAQECRNGNIGQKRKCQPEQMASLQML